MTFNIFKNNKSCGFITGNHFNLINSDSAIHILKNNETVAFLTDIKLTKVENKDNEYNLYL